MLRFILTPVVCAHFCSVCCRVMLVLQYFFYLVLQEIRTQLKPLAAADDVVEDLVWLDVSKTQDQEQASQKNKAKNRKKKEKRKAKKAQNSQTTNDVESVSDAVENEEFPSSNVQSPSVSSLDGSVDKIPATKLPPSCFDHDAEKRLLASLYEQISDESDGEDELDEELMQEMEELRQQQLGAAKEDRQALRNKLAERFEQLVASSSPGDQAPA